MTKRKTLSRLARTRIFEAAKGVCCLCDQPILASRGEKHIIEHIVPLWLGGADDESNMKPAHYGCAIEKTRKESPVKAKSDRVRARHLGIKKPRTITSWQKFNGDVVRAGRDR